MSEPTVTISVVNWNQCELLRECLDSIVRHTDGVPCEIIVVDNASQDGSREMVCARFPQVHVIANRENVGYGRAHNQAMRQARGRYLFLLNNDVLLLPRTLPRLVAFMEEHPEAGAVGCRYYTDTTCTQTQPSAFRADPTPWNDLLDRVVGQRIRRQFPHLALAQQLAARWDRACPVEEEAREVAQIVGAAMMTRREVIADGVLFDETFDFFFEETDWCRRLRQRGWKVYWVPSAAVVHLYSRSFAQRSDREELHYASYLKYLRKHEGLLAEGFARCVYSLARLRQRATASPAAPPSAACPGGAVMRPVVIAAQEFPPQAGGAGRFAEAIANGLPSVDVAVTVLTGRRAHGAPNGIAYERRVVPAAAPIALTYLTWRWHIRRALEEGARAVLATDILTQRACALLPKGQRQRCLVLAHGSDILANFGESWPKRSLYTQLYRDARAILANSHYTRNLLIQHGVDAEKVFVLHPWLSPMWWQRPSDGAQILARHGLTGKRVLLTVGRLSKRKAQDLVIQALPRIRERVPEAVYLIVGAGEQAASLQAQARACGVADGVLLVGEVSPAELMGYYDASEVFVMPSRRVGPLVEGFGIAYLEAQARGKPVVGTRTGGIAEAMREGETGVLVEPDDPEAVAKGVLEMLSDPARSRAMGQAARAWVADTFTWERASRVLLQRIR